MEDSRAARQYQMCFSVPPMKCLRHEYCPFHDGKDCNIDNGQHRQRSVQHINNPMSKKQEWSISATIRADK